MNVDDDLKTKEFLESEIRVHKALLKNTPDTYRRARLTRKLRRYEHLLTVLDLYAKKVINWEEDKQ